MSGHSKWATTKRHKAAVDAKRGKIFSILSKDITLTARSGGGDPNFNARLRNLIADAKEANMPADNITRAIKKGTGELEGTIIEEITYEAFAPGGVGIIIECTTDNKNRSVSEVRSTLTKAGGHLAGPGAHHYNFHRKGQFLVGKEKTTEEKLMEIALEAGAEDIINHKEYFEVLCAVNEFDHVREGLKKKGISPESAEISYIPSALVPVEDPEAAKKILKLIDALDELDDVKNVFSNYDIDRNVLQEMGHA
jgi:YebC/PmpR family DNA-binding regulatory protein